MSKPDIETGIPRTVVTVAAIEAVEPTEDMITAYSMRRTLYFITSIDLFFNILALLFSQYFNIIGIILVLIGWCGVRNYSSCPLIAYMVYAAIFVVVNIIVLATIKESAHVGYSVLLVLQALLYVWILELTYKFYNLLGKISPENLNILRNPGYVGQQLLILY